MSPKDDGYILRKSGCTIFHIKNTNRIAYSNALVCIRKYGQRRSRPTRTTRPTTTTNQGGALPSLSMNE
ncbi:MAG: hypothetical protein WBP64_14360 [Nitrososphaeraceae archaeon]